mmetsp:Transcript_7319/g.16020  ORF Transcript_7319/g.16020 Transcript_7319/m.16020 type:complete len:231 (-) Transcript_7319:74-766(-)
MGVAALISEHARSVLSVLSVLDPSGSQSTTHAATHFSPSFHTTQSISGSGLSSSSPRARSSVSLSCSSSVSPAAICLCSWASIWLCFLSHFNFMASSTRPFRPPGYSWKRRFKPTLNSPVGLTHAGLIFILRPLDPTSTPSEAVVGSSIDTSPDPVQSMTSITFVRPSVVVCRPMAPGSTPVSSTPTMIPLPSNVGFSLMNAWACVSALGSIPAHLFTSSMPVLCIFEFF